LLSKFGVLMGYEIVHFTAVDSQGKDIYHTNVMMALGLDFVIICLDAIKDEDQLKMIKQKMESTGKRIISISYKQMLKFAGNMLEVLGENEKRYTVMSNTAFSSLTMSQRNDINKTSNVFYVDIKTIEHYGGGSVRCMMAENFLKAL